MPAAHCQLQRIRWQKTVTTPNRCRSKRAWSTDRDLLSHLDGLDPSRAAASRHVGRRSFRLCGDHGYPPGWQEDCGVTINQLSGAARLTGSRGLLVKLFLMRSSDVMRPRRAAPAEIVQQLLGVLRTKRLVRFSQSDDAAIVSASSQQPAPRRFDSFTMRRFGRCLSRLYRR